ncbi:hypothetical protein MTR_3g011680 [Medicago truncatula]|uniref:Uncharacterized protein n=1 Tax=Medicago truncatula TaxID=3880 RepID=A0A072UT01_MEDTR|nr:hypothetical protein MTR_3g011680 [Medicago truncatula]
MHLNAAQLRLNHTLIHTVLKSRSCSLMLVNEKFEDLKKHIESKVAHKLLINEYF